MTERDQSRDRPGDEMVRVTVAEAARRLGISEAGVRKRIQRGQIPYERDDRRVWVWVSPGEVRYADDRDAPDQSRDRDTMSRDEAPLVEELRDRIGYLERQVEEERNARYRADELLARMMERLPELEAPREARESPTAGEAEQDRSQPRSSEATSGPQEGAERVPWWRRMFGG